jgi:actin-related protein
MLRDCLISTLLLDFQITSISMQPDLLMPILTSKKSSGIIIDIGINECTVIAVAYGYMIIQSLKVAAVGIQNCIKKFKKILELSVGHDVDYNISKDLFEKIGFCTDSTTDLYVAPRGGLSNKGFAISTRQSCFNHIVRGTIEDENDKDEFGGVAGSLLECIRSCPNDVRSIVSSNIIFCGEGSEIPGLPNAICREATLKANNDLKYEKIKDIFNSLHDQKFTLEECDYSRTNLSWIGGSLFSSLKSNDTKFIKLKDFSTNINDDERLDNVVDSERSLSAPDWMSLTTSDWIFLGPCRKLHT